MYCFNQIQVQTTSELVALDGESSVSQNLMNNYFIIWDC